MNGQHSCLQEARCLAKSIFFSLYGTDQIADAPQKEEHSALSPIYIMGASFVHSGAEAYICGVSMHASAQCWDPHPVF